MNRKYQEEAGKSLNCEVCPLVHDSEWRVLSTEERNDLDQVKRAMNFAKGGVIFHQGDACQGLYCIQAGTVALRKTDDQGNSVVLSLIHAGETLGIRSYFAGSDYKASAEALTPVCVCFIPSTHLDKLLKENAELDLLFLRHLSTTLGEANETILANTSLSVRKRLVHLLFNLQEHYSVPGSNGDMIIELPMTRHDMAELLATRPETVARTITALTGQGAVSFSGRRATIHDEAALRRELVED